MLTYNMDVTPESVWKRTTPSEAELAQPYYCTEAGVFYAQQHFSTARTDKESYILFYTLRGAGLIEQGESHVVLSTGQALLLNCRTPQSYCVPSVQSARLRMPQTPAHGRGFTGRRRPCAKITSRNFALPTCWQRRT